jgi:hypothetical protein
MATGCNRLCLAVLPTQQGTSTCRLPQLTSYHRSTPQHTTLVTIDMHQHCACMLEHGQSYMRLATSSLQAACCCCCCCCCTIWQRHRRLAAGQAGPHTCAASAARLLLFPPGSTILILSVILGWFCRASSWTAASSCCSAASFSWRPRISMSRSRTVSCEHAERRNHVCLSDARVSRIE